MTPFDLGPGAVTFLALVILGAAFVRGYSGFGFSALVVSSSALVTNPLNFVPVVMMLEIAATAGQAYSVRHDLNLKLLVLLLVGATAIMPFSIWILSGADIDVVRAAISSFILIMCAALLSGWSIRSKVGNPGILGVGAVSGVANAAAVGGLPVALFLAAQNFPARMFRATMIFYLCAIDIVALPMLGAAGLVHWETLVTAIFSLPLLGLGVWFGGRRFISASPDDFRRMAIGLLALLALLGLIRSFV